MTRRKKIKFNKNSNSDYKIEFYFDLFQVVPSCSKLCVRVTERIIIKRIAQKKTHEIKRIARKKTHEIKRTKQNEK